MTPESGGDGILKLASDGLLPVVVQDHLTGEIRMVAYANREAVLATLRTGRATFFSRSRGELWEKGKTSGNGLAVRGVTIDCDGDCLIYAVEPEGPSCHTGAVTCFFRTLDLDVAAADLAAGADAAPQPFLLKLEEELERRKASTAGASYTKSLLDGGAAAIGAKVEEEARELSAAVAGESDDRVVSEAADVLYHVMVALLSRNVGLRPVLAKLAARTGTSGHVEKASRSAK